MARIRAAAASMSSNAAVISASTVASAMTPALVRIKSAISSTLSDSITRTIPALPLTGGAFLLPKTGRVKHLALPKMREPPHLRQQAGGATNTQSLNRSVDMPINTTSRAVKPIPPRHRRNTNDPLVPRG